MRFLLLALALAASAAVHAERLSVERIFADPDLNGASPRGLKLAPDGRRVTFLRGRADDQNQLDLWQYEIASGRTERLVDSLALAAGGELSDAEKARRERARTAGLKGILDYRWAPDGKKLLFRVDERLWLLDLAARGDKRLRALTESGVATSDAKVSPRGHYVSWVGGQNLHVLELATGKVRALTRDGGGTRHNGEAEFVAEEEMGRRTGYWWAPDDSAIAFEQYDEAGVDEVSRSEVYADRTEVVRQRYPAAGRPNVRVRLGLVAPAGGEPRWIDLGPDPDIYLARVDWLPDAKRLAFQRQSRDQRRLELVAVDAADLHQETLLAETSHTWVQLHDDLRFLRQEDAFVWASDRDGWKHLHVIGLDGKLRRTLTRGDWDIDRLLALDEANGLVYFSSNRDDLVGAQVYVACLDGSDAAAPRRLSEGEGWHDAVFGRGAKVWIDSYSDPATPPQVSLRDANGKRIAWIEENRLDRHHPYWPYRDSLRPVEFGALTGPGGDALQYRLLKPLGFDPAKRHPVFMTYYGGPGSQYVRRAWGNHFEQAMAQAGYVVFALDNRGSPRRGRAFADAIFHELGKVEVADQLAGVDWLAAQPWVDASRIGIFGWSYGGFQTLMLLAKAGDRFAAGVAVAPVTDWTLYDTHYTERYLGTPQGNPEGYARSNVLHWAEGIPSGKLLLVHGMADDNVLFANSTALMADLQHRGTQFELMAYPGAKHGIQPAALRSHVHRLIADYFTEKLKPGT